MSTTNEKLLLLKSKYVRFETQTKNQSDNSLWFLHRRLRLISSNFGKIARRRDSTPVANQVKALLYSKPVDTKALRWGKSHEPDACDSYIMHLNSKGFYAILVKSSGLVISASDPYLAASPNGIVSYINAQNITRHGIVEYKCPYSLAEKSPIDGVPYCTPGLELKRTHCYYYQV